MKVKDFFRKKRNTLPSPSNGNVSAFQNGFPDINTELGNIKKIGTNLKQEGKNDGYLGYPNSNIQALSNPEKNFRAMCLEKANSIISNVDQLGVELKQKIEFDTVLLTQISIAKNNNKDVSEIIPSKPETKPVINPQTDPKIVFLQDVLEIEKKERVKTEGWIKFYEREHNPESSGFDSRWSYLTAMSLVSGLEIPINLTPALAIGEFNNSISLLIGVSLTVYLFAASHICGYGIGRNTRWQIYMGIVMCILMCDVIIAFRGGEPTPALLNIVIFLAGTFISSQRYRHYPYTESTNKLKSLNRTIPRLKADIEARKNELLEAATEATKKLPAPKETITDSQKRTQINHRLQSNSIKLNQLNPYKEELKKTINALFLQGVYNYRTANDKARLEENKEVVTFWMNNTPSSLFDKDDNFAAPSEAIPPPEPKHPVVSGSSTPIIPKKEEKEILRLEEIDPIIEAKKTVHNGSKPKKKLIPSPFTSWTIAILFFFCSSCGMETSFAIDSSESPITTDLVVLIDQTDQISQDETALADYVLHTMLQIDTLTGIRNGATITFSTINESAIQPIKKFHLEKGKDFWTRNDVKRKTKIKAFQQQLQATIHEIFQQAKEKKQSFVYGAIAEQLPPLIRSSSDRKMLLLLSDLLENSSTFSFYRYKKPSRIHQNYQQITQIFSAYDPLEDLTGIEVYIHHLPKKEYAELYRNVRSFWTRFFEAKNAAITFVNI